MTELGALRQENEKLTAENDKLKSLLAASVLPCIYCGLSASDMVKCPSGFPGCARMDDLMMDDAAIFKGAVRKMVERSE